MSKMKKFSLLIPFIFHFICIVAQNPVITIHQKEVLFKNSIAELKKESGYSFFYSLKWVDSTRVTLNADNQPVEVVFQQLAKQAGLKYIISGKNVIFSKDHYIKTNYKDEYLKFRLQQKAAADTIKYDLPKIAGEEKAIINLEYKLIKIGNNSLSPGNPNATLHGYIRDLETGEPLIGVIIYFEKLKKGDATNSNGFYSVTIPKGQYKIEYRNVGLKTTFRNVDIQSDGQLDIEMKIQLTALNEVLVTAKSDDKMKNLSMGVEKISFKTIMQLPTGMGEPDLIKSTLLLPGVQSAGEAASGFNVRGGSADQNLFLLNGASIINTSHFFGFFSGFNSDMVKDITLYKSSIPAEYGGRVSSVMDITLKEGGRKEIKASGAIGPVTGRLTLEGPIIKEKGSFIISSRSTYSDWVLRLLDDKQLKNSKAGFYDIQTNFTYELDKRNSINLSGYYSNDSFDYYQQDGFSYSTIASTLKWKHIISPRLFSTYSGIVSNYDYKINSRQNPFELYSLKYGLQQYNFKADFDYHPTIKSKIDFGFNSIFYSLSPGNRKPLDSISQISAKKLADERALESAVYLNWVYDLTPKISFSAGLRYSLYMMIGPQQKFNYLQNQPRNVYTLIDTVNYSSGNIVQHYSGPEPRISANFILPWNASVKIGYNRMYQYIHMISSTTTMSPTDTWKLSDYYLKPERGDQISIGFYKNLKRNTIEVSVETYYKKMANILDYKGGAQLLMNDHLETDVLNGTGKAYGVELMIEKKSGMLTGWASYTYSRVLHRIAGAFDEENVNNGDFFPANYDKPHNFKLIANFKFSRRVNFSTNFYYNTGRPYTMYLALYNFKDAPRVFYSDRNAFRMDDYIRLDLAATINGNLVAKKLNHGSFTFSLYNVLGRKNPYSIYFKVINQKVTGYKLSIFGQPIFMATYNFRIFGNAKDDF
jgi:hypothetical protein